MIKLSHDTFRSSPDDNGNCQRICIDPLGSMCKQYFDVYEGRRYSSESNKWSDPRHEQKCIAKFPANSKGTEQWATLEKNKSVMARDAATKLMRSLVDESDPQIIFMLPQYASLESVATLCKKRCKKEYVVCEDKLPNFTHFFNTKGEDVINKSSSTRKGNKKDVRRQSSKVCISKPISSCDQQHSCNTCSYHEMARPAETLDNRLTPTCPPYEENSPPSYEDIFGHMIPRTDLFQTGGMNFISNNIFEFPVGPPFNLNQYVHHAPASFTENRLDVHYTNSDSRSEITNSSHDQQDNYPHPLLRAFIHFYFCQTNGQRIICNLKGTCEDNDRYTLTTPIIHSLTRAYGERDEGEIGMIHVINNHHCSRWCRHLRNMAELFREAQNKAASNMSRH